MPNGAKCQAARNPEHRVMPNGAAAFTAEIKTRERDFGGFAPSRQSRVSACRALWDFALFGISRLLAFALFGIRRFHDVAMVCVSSMLTSSPTRIGPASVSATR